MSIKTFDGTYSSVSMNRFRYDIRTGKIIWEDGNHLDHALSPVLNQPEFKALIAQIKFMDGQITRYTEEEFDQLRLWLEKNDPQQMRQLFEQRILRNRPEVRARYRHSQLWNLFEQLSTQTTLKL